MPGSSLESAKRKIVGAKQTIKALEKGLAKKVFIASDADQHIIKPLIQLCKENNVVIVEVDTMKNLGKLCGIEVGCASAAIIEE